MGSMKYVGLDVHKTSIAVAVTAADAPEVRYVGEIRSTTEALQKLVRQLGAPDTLHVAYEAGPCGYGLYRTLRQWGCHCVVVAPSLIPVRPGLRVKTDRRDAHTLARLLRAGELTPVWVPDEAHEAVRDLSRAREDAKHAETRAKQRLSAFLLRRGCQFSGRSLWSKAHVAWLDTLRFDEPAHHVVLEEYRQALTEASQRVDRLTQQLREAVERSSLAAPVQALQTLRGVSLVVAATVVAEIGRLQRFAHPKQVMAYVGLVPSEHSSGACRRQGAITKSGNGHVRRMLVEASWSYRHVARNSAWLRRRQTGQPDEVTAIAWRAQLRLCARFRRLVGRGKPKPQVVTAIARELVAFMWEIDRVVPAAA
jgi:transposase